MKLSQSVAVYTSMIAQNIICHSLQKPDAIWLLYVYDLFLGADVALEVRI